MSTTLNAPTRKKTTRHTSSPALSSRSITSPATKKQSTSRTRTTGTPCNRTNPASPNRPPNPHHQPRSYHPPSSVRNPRSQSPSPRKEWAPNHGFRQCDDGFVCERRDCTYNSCPLHVLEAYDWATWRDALRSGRGGLLSRLRKRYLPRNRTLTSSIITTVHQVGFDTVWWPTDEPTSFVSFFHW